MPESIAQTRALARENAPKLAAILDRDFPVEILEPWLELVAARKLVGPFEPIHPDWEGRMFPLGSQDETPLFGLKRHMSLATGPTLELSLTGESQQALLSSARGLDRYFL